MSVLIKGMEMPRDCDHCKFMDREYDFGVKMCYLGLDDGIDIDTKLEHIHKGCPLVEVPTPHGRLIDADEFIKKHNFGYECDGCIFDGECNYDFSFTRMEICCWIEDAPTVIEANNK